MIFISLTLLFCILYILPGDPAEILLSPTAPPDVLQRVREQLGLNRPLYVQYFSYLTNLLQGNLGTSFVTKQPVVEMIFNRLPATVELAVPSMIFAMLIGIFAGAFSGVKRNKWFDFLNRIGSIIVYSMPIFWLGLILQLVFGVYLNLLPVSGRVTVTLIPPAITGFYLIDSLLYLDFSSFLSCVTHLILPVFSLGLWLSTIINRITRTHMVNVLTQDFILAARARGISERSVVYGHALKNALVPVITIMGIQFAHLLVGAIVTEVTFSIPGMGQLLFRSILDRDFPLIQGCVVFAAIIVAVIGIVCDVFYAYIDPRVRF
jgi:peptide/nickel transport system permease protein